MSPKVSVIVPVYNAEKFLGETVESILEQTYQDFEIIIVNDGSTDKSAEIIKSLDDERIICIYQKNQGVSAARNKAILQSRGEYIALLDHDDLWLPEKLEKQIPVLDGNSEVGLVYSDCYCVDIKEKVIERAFEQTKPFRGAVLPELFLSNFIPCLTAVIRKTVFEKAGLFDPKFTIAEEYDFFLRAAKNCKIEYVDLPLAKYRVHEGNISKDLILWHQEVIEILDRFLREDAEIRKQLGTRVHPRFYISHYSLARQYQFQKRFADARREFLSAIKYCPFCIKSYIGYLSSLLGIVIPSREKIVSTLSTHIIIR